MLLFFLAPILRLWRFSFVRSSFFNVVTSNSLHVQGRGLLRHTELELMWLVNRCVCRVCMHSVSGTLEIRWVHLPPTSQALRCDYCTHVCRDAQTIYCAALIATSVFFIKRAEVCLLRLQHFKLISTTINPKHGIVAAYVYEAFEIHAVLGASIFNFSRWKYLAEKSLHMTQF